MKLPKNKNVRKAAIKAAISDLVASDKMDPKEKIKILQGQPRMIAVKDQEPYRHGTVDNPTKLRSMGINGSLIAMFGAADTLIRQGQRDPVLNQKMGIPALQRMYNEANKMNLHFEKLWSLTEGDQMSFLAADLTAVMLVLSTVDLESRTYLTNEFRLVWAQLLESVGEEGAKEKAEQETLRILAARGIDGYRIKDGRVVFDKIAFNLGEGDPHHEVDRNMSLELGQSEAQQKLEAATVEDYVAPAPNTEQDNPFANVMLFVRDIESRQILSDATVHVKWGEDTEEGVKTHDLIKSTDDEALYERLYPVDTKIRFEAFKPGYLPGGCEKYLHAGDTEQLVVNIWMHARKDQE